MRFNGGSAVYYTRSTRAWGGGIPPVSFVVLYYNKEYIT